MAINPDAVGATSAPALRSWNSKDALLYAVGVGAGVTDPTGFELAFTTENTADTPQRALPTMCVVIGGGRTGPDGPWEALGSFDKTMMLHGAQALTLHRPLATEASVEVVSRIAGIYDKGKAALVIMEQVAVDQDSREPVYTTTSSLFMRGEGGWGGERGPSSTEPTRPDREPDKVLSYDTRTDQALLYRLNGDRNPLHSDPSFAKMGGFDKPILHGLCTYGFTGRALLHGLCDSDPDRFGSMSARFTSPVMPGETLDIHLWSDGDNHFFETTAGGRSVMSNGIFGHA